VYKGDVLTKIKTQDKTFISASKKAKLKEELYFIPQLFIANDDIEVFNSDFLNLTPLYYIF
jgi:hypothetical protein